MLGAGVQLCGIAAAGSGGYIVARYLSPIPTGLGEDEVEIPEGDLPPGKALQVLHKGRPVLVVRDREGNLHALSAVCTHLGCLVKWDEGDNQVVCPCHDARFNLQGTVLSGPAPEPLPTLPVGVEDGLITLEDKPS